MGPGYPKVGTTIGDGYVLGKVIGTGGSSLVYRATQLSMDRPVAVKFLSPLLIEDPVIARRFAQETRINVQLQHPNLIELYDAGITPDGLPYIVMELLEGQTLAQAIDAMGGKGMDPERVGTLARQILTGLGVVHDAQIIHRDIKPSNIFLCPFTGSGELVKVLDFGIAKVVTPDVKKGLPLLETSRLGGGRVGSPRYMAPETVKRDPPSFATDLFSVGLVLGELIAGSPIIPGTSVPEVLMRLKRGPALALPNAVHHSPFGKIIKRCLDFDASERYQSCDELLCDIVAVGVGGEETVQFSSFEALKRYEEGRLAFEQASTGAYPPTGGLEPISQDENDEASGDEPSEDAEDTQEHVFELPGRAFPQGPGRAEGSMRSTYPGQTEFMDTALAESEAQRRLGLLRGDTIHERTAVEDEPKPDTSARFYYAVAFVAVVLAVIILVVGLVVLGFFSPKKGTQGALPQEHMTLDAPWLTPSASMHSAKAQEQ